MIGVSVCRRLIQRVPEQTARRKAADADSTTSVLPSISNIAHTQLGPRTPHTIEIRRRRQISRSATLGDISTTRRKRERERERESDETRLRKTRVKWPWRASPDAERPSRGISHDLYRRAGTSPREGKRARPSTTPEPFQPAPAVLFRMTVTESIKSTVGLTESTGMVFYSCQLASRSRRKR